jgi:hypothetical protein
LLQVFLQYQFAELLEKKGKDAMVVGGHGAFRAGMLMAHACRQGCGQIVQLGTRLGACIMGGRRGLRAAPPPPPTTTTPTPSPRPARVLLLLLLQDVVRKTWVNKMGERGRAAALEMAPSLPPDQLEVVQRALAA